MVRLRDLILFFRAFWAASLAAAAATGPSGLRGVYYGNAMLLPSPSDRNCTRMDAVKEGFIAFADPLCAASSGPYSVRFDGAFADGKLAVGASYDVAVRANVPVRLWVRGWKLVDAWSSSAASASALTLHEPTWNFTVADELRRYPIRLETLVVDRTADKEPMIQLLLRQRTQMATPQPPYAPVPGGGWIVPTVTPEEDARQALQRRLALSGFNTWHRASAAAHVHLPTGFGVALSIRPAGGQASDLLTWDFVDKCKGADSCTVRPGVHTYTGSLTQIERHTTPTVADAAGVTGGGPKLSYQITSAHLDSSGDEVVIVVRANDTHAAQGSALVARAGFDYFDCPVHEGACGTVTLSERGASARPNGFGPLEMQMLGGTIALNSTARTTTVALDAAGLACIAVGMPGGAASKVRTAAHCLALAAAAAERHEAAVQAQYPRHSVGANRDVVDALRSVVGWNIMWDPEVKVVAPVSRNFGVQPFSLWLWDTYFLSLLASESSMDLAFSNIIEVTRPTVYGDVPGIRTATEVALDRSKPYVGALVLREHYRRFGHDRAGWLVELLFDDLLVWTNWIRDRRTLPLRESGSGNSSSASSAAATVPAGLIALGSDNLTVHVQSGKACSTTHAKWESGLDNSPMYDAVETGSAAANEPCFFPLWDVGMTGLYLAQCDALADLADTINRTAEATELRKRVAAMSASLNDNLWHEELGVYSNRFVNGTFYPRISPFNFHPMLSGAASEANAARMAEEWLMGADGFCLGAGGSCRYGLPSIARSDPAFKDQDYWRGRTWGPMNYLVYQGLSHPRYAHVAEVQRAKALLANASRALLLGQWLEKHHVHENYNAINGEGDDVSNSNPFYHWGALLGFVALKEDGLV